MKKRLSNTDIVVIYNTLNTLKGRDDIVIGDMDMFWAIRCNHNVFKDKAAFVQEIIQEKVQSYFTDENTDIVDDQKVIKEELRDEISAKINADVNELNSKAMEVELTGIKIDSLKEFVKANASKLSMLEMTVLEQFVDEEKKETTEDAE